MKEVFTTGEVAKICGVSTRTVVKWLNSNKLHGYRLPLGTHRRIRRKALVIFMKEHGVPLDCLERELSHNILIVGADQLFVTQLQQLLPGSEDYRVATASSGFEGGLRAESFAPSVIIVDFTLGGTEGLQIAQSLRKTAAHQQTFLIGLTNEDVPNREAALAAGYSAVFQKPVNPDAVAKLLRTFSVNHS